MARNGRDVVVHGQQEAQAVERAGLVRRVERDAQHAVGLLRDARVGRPAGVAKASSATPSRTRTVPSRAGPSDMRRW